MSTQDQNVLDKKDRDELVDFSVRLGQVCWNVYCCSKIGFVRVLRLPNGVARRRAQELFQLGFSARMIICPPVGIDAIDAIAEPTLGDRAWESYLGTMNTGNGRRPTGAGLLEGEAVRDETASFSEITLRRAKEFFLEGFRAGTIAVREILNS